MMAISRFHPPYCAREGCALSVGVIDTLHLTIPSPFAALWLDSAVISLDIFCPSSKTVASHQKHFPLSGLRSTFCKIGRIFCRQKDALRSYTSKRKNIGLPCGIPSDSTSLLVKPCRPVACVRIGPFREVSALVNRFPVFSSILSALLTFSKILTRDLLSGLSLESSANWTHSKHYEKYSATRRGG